MTTTDALHQHAPDVLAIVELNDELKAQLQAAMQEYAEEKARHFDYLEEHPTE